MVCPICPICHGTDTRLRVVDARDRLFETTTRTFSLMSCARCQCLFIDPLPTRQELADFYPQHYWWKGSSKRLSAIEDYYRRIVLHGHLSRIRDAATSLTVGERPLRLLDVGCGSGTLLEILQRRGFDVFGFEPSAEAARLAMESGLTVVSGEGLESASFAANSFHIITLFHVLEHVTEPRRVLAEVRRVMDTNGRILVQVPNIESWQSRLCGTRWCGLDVPRHVINYSIRAIRTLLSDSGFRIRRVRHFNLRDNAAAFASSISPGLDPMRRYVRAGHRNQAEPNAMAWARHAAYATLIAAVYPIVIAESLCGAGGTIMLEAERA
jgi:2-polyprenyl-3-methyl-5-hydroxy-6-metoxy-1,4-benzoquinol methylase